MKSHLFAAAAAVLMLAACGQAKAPETEATTSAVADTPLAQVQAKSPEDQVVFAFQALATYQAAHADSVPRCTAVRLTEARPIPANVAPDSAYAPFAGNSYVYSVQCGPMLSGTRYDPNEHWVVAFTDAPEPTVVHCADASGKDICPREVPTAAATATTTTTP